VCDAEMMVGKGYSLVGNFSRWFLQNVQGPGNPGRREYLFYRRGEAPAEAPTVPLMVEYLNVTCSGC
jgi:hypothetical protein